MKFSLIVTTRGRTEEVTRLFRSLKDQTLQDFEVIVSDQNDDDRLVPVLKPWIAELKVTHVRSSGGASSGRNRGIDEATGEILSFPDDDCAFPADLLERVANFFQSHPEYGYLSGRSYADDGRDSVSKHARHASAIDKMTVLSQCIEFAIFIRSAALGAMRFDPGMGPGSPGLWQCDEGPDLMLRLEATGVRGFYDPEFGAWHPRPIRRYDEKEISRSYKYACATGYFFRKHHYPAWFVYYQMSRVLGGALLGVVTFQFGKARVYFARLRGQWKGWESRPAAAAVPSVGRIS
jgi:glycosyltransferase involved in cell wall biosynthesis